MIRCAKRRSVLRRKVKCKPREDFYYTSTIQQTQFQCAACNSFNDIRGRYGYCASCGWRNNFSVLKGAFVSIRERINDGRLAPEEAVKQAISEFDSAARNFVDQPEALVPMKKSRRAKVQDLLFHNLDRVDEVMKSAFDINLLQGLNADRNFVGMMFHRRHVYEHDGGVATA